MIEKLFKALESKNEDQFSELLKDCSDINTPRYGDHYNTLLHASVDNDLINSVKLLLDKKAKIYAENNQGKTALHIACGKIPPNLDIIQVLLDNDASITPTDHNGLEPIECISDTISDETYQKLDNLFNETEKQRKLQQELRFALAPHKIANALVDKLKIDDHQSDQYQIFKQLIIFTMLDFSDQYKITWYLPGTSLSRRLTTALATLKCLDDNAQTSINTLQAIILISNDSQWGDHSFATHLFKRFLKWTHPELSQDKITGNFVENIFNKFKKKVDVIDEQMKNSFEDYRNKLTWLEVEKILTDNHLNRDNFDKTKLTSQNPEIYFFKPEIQKPEFKTLTF